MKRLRGWTVATTIAALAAAGTARGQQPERIVGGGDVALAVYEGGNPAGHPIVLMHGFLGSHLVWANQLSGPLADEFRLVRFDLRGHGASDKPDGAESYTSSRLWAEDVHAVLAGKELERPVLVGWSYGGFMIADYLREYGDSGLGGIVIVGSTAAFGTEEAASLIGEEMLEVIGDVLSPDVGTMIGGTRAFLPLVTLRPMSEEAFEATLAAAMMVPPAARQGMFGRAFDNADVFAEVSVPSLVVQGSEDRIVRPRAAEELAALIPGARLVVMDGVGHAPFLEDPERFDAELAAFVRKSAAAGAGR